MTTMFHVLSKENNFTRHNFQRHAHLKHYGNYMAGSALKYTLRKGQNSNRQSQTKHVNAKQKTVWIKKNDLKGYVVHTTLKAHNSNMWYLDSGCSRHMCGNKAFFDNVMEV